MVLEGVMKVWRNGEVEGGMTAKMWGEKEAMKGFEDIAVRYCIFYRTAIESPCSTE